MSERKENQKQQSSKQQTPSRGNIKIVKGWRRVLMPPIPRL